MLKESQRIFGLDIVRALAISLVLVSHCTFLVFPDLENNWLNVIRGLGAFGVDVFFVLSGYLIGGIILKMIDRNETKFNDLFRFWKRRWFRTLPNYFLVLIINIALGVILGIIDIKTTLPYFLFLQNFTETHPEFFTEAWSLSIEEYAYLCFPFLLYFIFQIFKRINKHRLFIVTLLLTFLLLFLVKWNYYLESDFSSYKEWSGSFRKVVIYRLDAIYFGFIVVYLMRCYKDWFTRNKVALLSVGILLFCIAHVYIAMSNLLPNNASAFYVFAYLQILVISIGLSFPFMVHFSFKKFPKKAIVYISLRSYALYLVNYSIVLLTIESVFNVSEYSLLWRLLIMLLFLLISIGLSHYLFKYFERPILVYRDRILKR
jgi:peptidoglycan/LPS O-acetylase OafA/YrhL